MAPDGCKPSSEQSLPASRTLYSASVLHLAIHVPLCLAHCLGGPAPAGLVCSKLSLSNQTNRRVVPGWLCQARSLTPTLALAVILLVPPEVGLHTPQPHPLDLVEQRTLLGPPVWHIRSANSEARAHRVAVEWKIVGQSGRSEPLEACGQAGPNSPISQGHRRPKVTPSSFVLVARFNSVLDSHAHR